MDKVRWYHSLRCKLALSYILVSLAPLVFFYSTVLARIESYYINERQGTLLYLADIESNILVNNNYFEFIGEPRGAVADQAIGARASTGGYRTIVFDDKFRVIKDTNMVQTGNTLIVPEVVIAMMDRNNSGINREEMAIYAAAAMIDSNGDHVGVVLLSESIEEVFASLEAIQQMILFYTFFAIAIVGVLVIFASQLLLDPLKGIVSVVQRMSEGYLNQRIPVKGKSEYSQLATVFNDMAKKLERVEKAREEFVSNVSHELKTPLSSIKVLSESILLQDEVPIETHKEFLQDITSEVDRMTVIVNDLLDLVKLDSREHGFNASPIELNHLVEDILKRLQPIADQKQIELSYEDLRQTTIEADEVKLSLAISNIVENGIKYTPNEGSVTVTVDSDHQNAFITIQDTGIGIPEEEQALIFNRFYRVDKTRDRDTGGTGLGLAISHSAVLLHNGSLRLSSKTEEGSTFIIRLPLRRAAI